MEINIKKGIKECKERFWINLVMFIILGTVLSFVFLMSLSLTKDYSVWMPYIGVFSSFLFSFLIFILLRENIYFSFQEIETRNLYQVGNTTTSLKYCILKIQGESDESDKVICKVIFIDGQLQEGMILKLPKSQIFLKTRFLWKQKFKSIE